MAELSVGALAPDFELLDDSGKPVRLSGLRGRAVVLFFYPEDDTPGCTQQACGFRDKFAQFRELGAVVLGISPDSVDSHRAFKAKFGFPFALLCDPGNVVARRYGAFGSKLMYGKEVQGTIRSSIVIDAEGRIASVHRNVRTAANGARMVEVVRGLEKSR
jgi:thioredoxin-dependent peroxiredoxin